MGKWLWVPAVLGGCLGVGCDGQPREPYGPAGEGRPLSPIEQKLESWLDAPAAELFEAWGRPDQSVRRPNGRWEHFYHGIRSADQHATDLFDVGFKVDRRGIIYRYTYQAWGY